MNLTLHLFFFRASIRSRKCYLLSEWDFCEFRMGSPYGHWGTQWPALQRAVSEMLRWRALWGLRRISRRWHWREARWRFKRWGGRWRDSGALGLCNSEVRPSSDWFDRALGHSAQPGGSHQLLLPHPGHECCDSPEQWADTLCCRRHHDKPGR